MVGPLQRLLGSLLMFSIIHPCLLIKLALLLSLFSPRMLLLLLQLMLVLTVLLVVLFDVVLLHAHIGSNVFQWGRFMECTHFTQALTMKTIHSHKYLREQTLAVTPTMLNV
ncbi:hypothetical protein O6H91_03G118200 [Diphasiastrum complanatum]|uniref:Uncharacterized protein n=1 Tax=Diphasiastrum complanatum TaxID=34168 RepID=A0ACC2EBA2_DIPCM|nr:hypothetical protein O6H91_03G118200 [Diphasiastrum complanatum]